MSQIVVKGYRGNPNIVLGDRLAFFKTYRNRLGAGL
jgi:hypothetical protein